MKDKIVKLLLRAVIKAFYKVEIKGLENIPKHGPALLAMNHQSYLDAIALYAFSERDITFLAYYKLFEVKFVGNILKKHKDIAIKDKDVEQIKHAFEQCCDVLNDNKLLCIFPEGTLSPDGKIHSFKSGIKHLWMKCPKPIIPIAIDGFWHTAFSRRPLKDKLKTNPFKRKILKIIIAPSISFNGEPAYPANLQTIVEKLQVS